MPLWMLIRGLFRSPSSSVVSETACFRPSLCYIRFSFSQLTSLMLELDLANNGLSSLLQRQDMPSSAALKASLLWWLHVQPGCGSWSCQKFGVQEVGKRMAQWVMNACRKCWNSNGSTWGSMRSTSFSEHEIPQLLKLWKLLNFLIQTFSGWGSLD